MSFFNSFMKICFIVLIITFLSACGKGRGVPSSDPPENPESEVSLSEAPPSRQPEGKEVQASEGKVPPAPSSVGSEQKKEEDSLSAEATSSVALGKGDVSPFDNTPEVKVKEEEFPMMEHFTLKDFENSGLLGDIKEKDKHFYFSAAYLHNVFVYVDNSLRAGRMNPGLMGYFKPFCIDKDDCSKGIDLNSLTRSHIAYLVKLVGLFLPTVDTEVSKSDDEKVIQTESLLILQGFYKNMDVEHWIKKMEENNTTAIIINLSWSGIWSQESALFFRLGEYIQKKQIDLYIEGKCDFLCFNYLLPAARKIYMGPYGHVSTSGSIGGLMKDVTNTLPRQKKAIEERLIPPPYSTVGFVKKSFTDKILNLNFSQSVREDKVRNFFTAMEEWEEGVGTRIGKLLLKFIYDKPGKESLLDLSEEDIGEFSERLSPEEKASLKRFFIEIDPLSYTSNQYQFFLSGMAQVESDYYEDTIKVKESLVSSPGLGYTFFDFLDLASYLVKEDKYTEYFMVTRSYYDVPEDDRFYKDVAPSVGLLRSLGLDIKGENRLGMFELRPVSEGEDFNLEEFNVDDTSKTGKTLYLDEKRMMNCNFFALDATYTERELKDCLARE